VKQNEQNLVLLLVFLLLVYLRYVLFHVKRCFHQCFMSVNYWLHVSGRKIRSSAQRRRLVQPRASTLKARSH